MTINLQPSRAFAGWWQLSIIPAIYCVIQNGNYEYLFASFLMFAIYTTLGHHVGLHRYFAHAQFETTKFGEYVLAFFACAGNAATPTSYVVVHSIHHRNSDTMDDMHGPQFGLKSLLLMFHKPAEPHVLKVARNRQVIKLSRRYKHIHTYYKAWVFAWAALLCAIDFELMLYLWWLPSCISLWSNGLAVYFQHDENGAVHHNWYGFIHLGEIFHDVHHDKPRLFNTAIKPGQVDTTYWVARLFFEKKK